jgi:hypothetical protein
MTTFSDQLYHLGGVPVGVQFTGKAFFVKPSTGSDSNTGKTPARALKTLARALALSTANKNDVVYLISEGNASADCTDYQSSALDWNKDGVHLIGINSGNGIQNRSRIAQLSTATNVDDLFTVSADNCYIANISVYHGVDDATSKGAVKVTGQRNKFYNCTFSGIGHATMDTADNYSLKVSGGAENVFEGCYIGLDTIARGTAANSEIVLDTGATRNVFKNCNIVTYAEANTHQFVIVPVNGLDRWTIFDHCIFMNMPTGDASGTTMTEAFEVTGGGSPDGIIFLNFCSLVGATDWEAATVSGKVMIRTDAGTAATAGLTGDVAAA